MLLQSCLCGGVYFVLILHSMLLSMWGDWFTNSVTGMDFVLFCFHSPLGAYACKDMYTQQSLSQV